MILKVFSVFDDGIKSFAQPFFCRAKGEALRSFMAVCNDKDSMICKHPQDYTLFELGDYDDSKGLLISHQAPIPVGLALEFKEKVQ